MGPSVRPLPNPGRGAALRPINLRDFRGGLVSRDYNIVEAQPDQLRTASNVLLQVGGSIGRRGGFNRQKTLTPSSNFLVPMQGPEGDMVYFGYSGTTSYYGSSSSGRLDFLTSTAAGVDARFSDVYTAGANSLAFMSKAGVFSSYVYVACGGTANADKVTYRYNIGGVLTAMTSSLDGPAFQDSFASPSGAHFPKCAYVEAHLDYMFCAIPRSTAGIEGLCRIRWSHPGDGGSWRTNDYIDIPELGRVTGMISIGQQLVIFGMNAVYALTGYSAETFALHRLHDTGVTSPTSMTVSADGSSCYWGDSQGVWRWNANAKEMVSSNINFALRVGGSSAITYDTRSPFVHFSHYGRPFLVVPWTDGSAHTFYVLAEDTGGWVNWSWTPQSQSWLVPFTSASIPGGLVCFDAGRVQSYDINASYDTVDTTPANIPASFTTAWFDAGQPAVKKSWKRPEIVYRSNVAGNYTLDFYKDYIDTVFKTMTAAQAGSAANYEVDKLTNVGTARAISLKVTIPTASSNTFSIEDIVLKYRPKPLRN